MQTYLIVTMDLHKRKLTLLWSAQIISAAGDSIYQMAQLWLVLYMINFSIILGLVAMSAYLPALVFGLYAGVILLIKVKHSSMKNCNVYTIYKLLNPDSLLFISDLLIM